MKYKIELVKDSNMVYMRSKGAYGTSKNFEMMKKFKEWVASNKLKKQVTDFGILGIALDNPKKIPPNECRYDLILFVSDEFKADGHVQEGRFLGGKYAVVTIPHTMETVQNFWLNIEKNVNRCKLDRRNAPIIERFKEEEGKCEFLIPIR